jgi:hypothetical protein
MPIDPGTTTPIFTAALIANAQIGPSVGQLATGLALGLFQYAQAGVTVNSIDAGTLGVGTGIGPSILLPEPLLLAALTASFAGHGIIGPMMPLQANAIALGISSSLALAIVQTLNPLVGLGAGKLQLTPTGAGSAIFPAAFIQAGMAGPQSANMGTAIALALDAVIASAISIIAIVGPPNIVPGAGLGIGKIV